MRGFSLLFLGALFSIGCAASLSLRELNSYVLNNEFGAAAEKVETQKSGYGEKNALLYYLDRGMLLQLAGNYTASNLALETAKKVAQDLFTKSVTAHLTTFLVNDLMTPYYGEDFERALIHVFSAVNYAAMNDGENALVECRQLDSFFRALPFDGQRNAYQDDAFARYLAGLLYEERGETNDAYISYMKALDAYGEYEKLYKTERPPGLVEDALRTARRLGFSDKFAEIQKKWGPASFPEKDRATETGEVIVLHYSGLGPEKVDSFFEISLFNGWPYVEKMDAKSQDETSVEQARAVFRSMAADKMIRVAFPKYRRTPTKIVATEVQSASATWRASLVEDVGAIAVRNLDDRINRIRGRAIARAMVKFLLSQKVSKAVEDNGNETMGYLVRAILQAASAATEVADKRSWRTLPDRILMARLSLPAGNQDLILHFLDARGSTVETRKINQLTVTPHRKTFLIVRSAL